jgi:hypothetical protein
MGCIEKESGSCLNQFDLNLFMITTENSSIFRLLTKESMLLTSATFLIERGRKRNSTKGRHVTYNTRQSVPRRKRIYTSFVKSKIPKIFEVVYR